MQNPILLYVIRKHKIHSRTAKLYSKFGMKFEFHASITNKNKLPKQLFKWILLIINNWLTLIHTMKALTLILNITKLVIRTSNLVFHLFQFQWIANRHVQWTRIKVVVACTWATQYASTFVHATSCDVESAHCVAAVMTRFWSAVSSATCATFLAFSTSMAAALATALARFIIMSWNIFISQATHCEATWSRLMKEINARIECNRIKQGLIKRWRRLTECDSITRLARN